MHTSAGTESSVRIGPSQPMDCYAFDEASKCVESKANAATLARQTKKRSKAYVQPRNSKFAQ